jgi:Putative restriction endonuclease
LFLDKLNKSQRNDKLGVAKQVMETETRIVMQAVKEITEQLRFLPKAPILPIAQVEMHTRMSYAEWLDAFDEETHTEWVDGEALVFVPPTEEHQDVVTFLVELTGPFVRQFRLGKLLVSPFEMKLSPESNARKPDLLFVASENLARLTGKRLDGPADLVIEVISPESVYRDRSDKFDEYQAAGGAGILATGCSPRATAGKFLGVRSDWTVPRCAN